MPQPFNNAVMTDSGAALLTKVQSGACKMKFTRMAVGNGVYEEGEKSVDALRQCSDLKALCHSYMLTSIAIFNVHSVKITALITNQDPVSQETIVDQGYYINEIGLYAQEEGREDSEILYSIAVTSGVHGDFMPPYNGFNPVQIIQDYYATVSNAAEVTIEVGNGAVALAKDLDSLREQIQLLTDKIESMSRVRVRIGPADTVLERGDTLFIVEGMLPEKFEAASYSNIVFSASSPADAQYWADMSGSAEETESAEHSEDVLITNGKLAVSTEADAPADTAFLAQIK